MMFASPKRVIALALVGLFLVSGCRFECTIGTVEREPRARGDPEFGEIVLSHGIEGIDGAPTDDVETFTTDDDVIYAVMHVDNVRARTTFTARWYFGEEEVFNVSSDLPEDLVNTHVHTFLRPNGEFLPGPHSVEIFFNDVLQGRRNFTIE